MQQQDSARLEGPKVERGRNDADRADERAQMKQMMYLGAVGAQAVASAALIPVLTHSLTPADYGTVGVIAVIQQFATMIFSMGLPGMVTSWESGAATGELIGESPCPEESAPSVQAANDLRSTMGARQR